MIQVAVLGAGMMGKAHVQALTQIEDVAIHTITATRLERASALAQTVGARAEIEIDRVLDDPQVEVIDITLPTPLHAPIAIRALEAGKHVIVEKPMALTLAEADAMIEASIKANRLLLVAHLLRFWPEYQAIQARLSDSQGGSPLFMSAYRLSKFPTWGEWFRDPEASGGAVLDLHIHDLDVANWLLGTPLSVRAQGVQTASGAWNHVTTLIEYASGASASVEGSLMMPNSFPFRHGVRVLREHEAIEYQMRAGGSSFEMGQPENSFYVFENAGIHSLAVEKHDPFVQQLQHFIACIRAGEPSQVITPQQARLALQVSLASKASLISKKTVLI